MDLQQIFFLILAGIAVVRVRVILIETCAQRLGLAGQLFVLAGCILCSTRNF